MSPLKVSEEYKKVYHYTTLAGLQGILKTQSLWATHYQYLNDSEELIHAKSLIRSLLIPQIKTIVDQGIQRDARLKEYADAFGGPEKFVQEESTKFVTMLYDALLEGKDGLRGPFILAFCAENKDPFIKENGLLSQWRAYGRDGGYCIEFDTQGLEKVITEEFERFYYAFAMFADVGYGKDLAKVPRDFRDNIEFVGGGAQEVYRKPYW